MLRWTLEQPEVSYHKEHKNKEIITLEDYIKLEF